MRLSSGPKHRTVRVARTGPEGIGHRMARVEGKSRQRIWARALCLSGASACTRWSSRPRWRAQSTRWRKLVTNCRRSSGPGHRTARVDLRTRHTLEPLAWHASHWSGRLVNRVGKWFFSNGSNPEVMSPVERKGRERMLARARCLSGTGVLWICSGLGSSHLPRSKEIAAPLRSPLGP